MSPYEQSLAERKINRWKRERPPALCVWHSEPHPVKRTEKKYKVFPADSHVLLAAFYTVTKGTKLSENRTVIKKLSFEIPQAGSLIFAYCGAKYARFTPKIAAMLKALFRVVKNGSFAV